MREDWDKAKDDIMFRGLMAKFNQHAELAAVLLNTGTAQLGEVSSTTTIC